MARRSSEASLKPNIIAFSYGKPTPGIVRALMLTAHDNHKNRQHHEAGAYLFAAILALENYIEDLERDGKAAADQARTWRWHIPIKSAAAAAGDLATNSHNAQPGAGAGELRNGNNNLPEPSEPTRMAEPLWCVGCTHLRDKHNGYAGACTAKDCSCVRYCETDEICDDCGHKRSQHGLGGGECQHCDCAEFNEPDLEW